MDSEGVGINSGGVGMDSGGLGINSQSSRKIFTLKICFFKRRQSLCKLFLFTTQKRVVIFLIVSQDG